MAAEGEEKGVPRCNKMVGYQSRSVGDRFGVHRDWRKVGDGAAAAVVVGGVGGGGKVGDRNDSSGGVGGDEGDQGGVPGVVKNGGVMGEVGALSGKERVECAAVR